MNRRKSSRSVLRSVIACAALGVLLVSCSDDADAPQQSDVCTDSQALRESVDALKNVDVTAEGTNGLTAAVNEVKADLTALHTSAGAALQPQVKAVEDDLAQVQTAAAQVGSGGGPAAVEAVSALADSSATLLSSLEQGACGESTTPTT